MKQALHIFRKDVRRLWPAIALTVLLQAVLVWEDARRADFTPSALEGFLNLLLPAAWAFLIALAVQDEGFVEDRAFWLTRPYNRKSLALAKLLFLLVAIHAVLLLADVVILTARGFLPWEHLPHLLWKQLMLAAAVTVPAAALAAVTKGFPQFGFAAAVLVVVAVMLRTGVESRAPWIPPELLRRYAAFFVIAAASAIMLALQYSRRWTRLSRTVGLGCATAAAAAFTLIPKDVAVKARCALRPDVEIAPVIRYAPEAPQQENYAYVRSSVAPLVVPVQITGLENFAETGFEQLSLRIHQPLEGGLGWARQKPFGVQHLNIPRADFPQVASAPVTIRGSVAATVWRSGQERTASSVNGFTRVPGLGHCYTSRVETPHGGDLLKVMCETPGDIPLLTNIRLHDPSTGQEWKHRLGDSYTDVRYPSESFLSPLTRRQTFFHVRRVISDHPGDRWTVPEESLSRSHFTLSAMQVAGCRIIDYEIDGVELTRHIVKTR